jgi:acyl-CoA hydrolase
MEVGVLVTAQGSGGKPSRRANTAYLTFVALDDQGKPVPVPAVEPETDIEQKRFAQALERRERRLAHRRQE